MMKRFQPPVRRVLAVDAGSRRLRLALVQSRFGRVEVLREEALDLHEEGLVATEELQAHLAAVRAESGDPPVVLVLPQHLSVSQTVALPPAPENEIRKRIADEIRQLAGVSESAIVHDYTAVGPPTAERRQFRVTFCRQEDIEERIRQLGLEADDLCEVTTTANALAIASRGAMPRLSNVIVVHLGAQSTVVLMLAGGQAVFAASFPVGGDSFTRVIAKARPCAPETAEALRCQENLFTGPGALPELKEFVDGWATELKRQVKDAFTHHQGANVGEFTLVASGTGFNQPGMMEYLNGPAALPLQPWPTGSGRPLAGFEIAYGAALQALNLTTQPVSLLPAPRRAAWQRRQASQLIEFASVALLVLCFFALTFGVWQKLSLLHQRQFLLSKADAALESLADNRALTDKLMMEYGQVRPLLERQQNATDTLATLELLQHSRSNLSFWYVLLADQHSYFNAPVPDRTGRTNAPAAEGEFASIPPAKPGVIVELCVPEGIEASRRVLSGVVNGLKELPRFSKVDLLSDDLRRNLADPKVILPERHFALAVDFAATEFQPPPSARRNRTGDGNNGTNPKFSRRSGDEKENGP